MKVTVNGEARELADGCTVRALLEELGTMRNGIAVARNDCVVRRSEYDTQALADGDSVEIIKAVAGG